MNTTDIRFRNGWLARLKWPCYIGWHAQRMKVMKQGHIVLTCACCDWKGYGGHV